MVKLAFIGDVMLGRLVNRVLHDRSAAEPWSDTLPLLAQADLRICNLECALSDVGEPWETWPAKAFHFRSDERNVRVLQAAGIDVVSLANNHVLDFGEAGMQRTVAVLDAAGIGHAGAGLNIAEAAMPAIRAVHGMRIGIVAFTDNEPDWSAGPDTPGTFYVPLDAPLDDPACLLLFDTVRSVRSDVDLLVVSAHWGPNWGDDPSPEHVRFGRALIEAGADVVFGHSGHVVRGIELYGQRPILYCAGDFIDDYAVDPIERNDWSALFLIEMTPAGVEAVDIYPTLIENFGAVRATGQAATDMLRRLERLCRRLGTEAHIDVSQARLEIAVPTAAGAVSPEMTAGGPGRTRG